MSLKDDLIRDEGVRLHLYPDSMGKLTIGVGRNLEDEGISEAEAQSMLGNDIAKAEAELDRTCAWWRGRPEPVQRGLTNMMFNMGAPRLLGFKRMLSCLQAGDFDNAAAEALDSTWAQQVGDRATRIAKLFISAKEKA